jgi:hypothetical protein
MRIRTSKRARSFCLGLLLLTAVFINCSRTQVAEYKEMLSLRLEHTPVQEHVGPEGPMIRATIISSFDLDEGGTMVMYRKRGKDFASIPMMPTVLENEYVASLPQQPRGTQVEYYIQVRSITGATITLPQKAIQTGASYLLTFQGRVPPVLSAVHFGCVLIGLFLILVAGYWAILYLKSGNKLPGLAKATLAGTIFLFIGGIPLHIIVKYQTLGSVWEGIPIGTDRTDTLTLFLILVWVVVLTLFKGTLIQGEEEKNIVSNRTFATLVLIGAIATVIIFLLPS